MRSIADTLKAVNKRGHKALIPYITAGDPTPEHTVRILHALVNAGADVIELGVPFTDPMADGPVIQLACERALKSGTTLAKLFNMVNQFRQQDQHTPIVLMGYLNPVESIGLEAFAERCKQNGVDGLLLVDMPPEEAASCSTLLRAKNLDQVFLTAPTTTEERLKAVCRSCSGFVYYVSVKGVTGAAKLDYQEIGERVGKIKQYTELPVAVGFGIRDQASAKAVSAHCDGVVIGSALVNLIAEHQNSIEDIEAALTSFLKPISNTLRGKD